MQATYSEEFTEYFQENCSFKYNFYTIDFMIKPEYFHWFKKKGWCYKHQGIWFFAKEALRHYEVLHPETKIEYVR